MFISFEGIDGSGKTTQIQRVASLLAKKGISVIKTCEPGGTSFGKEIRSILTIERNAQLSNLATAFLISAARHEHVTSVVVPALNQGRWVLCDRFIDSTYAYQFFETELDIELYNLLIHSTVGKTIPDRTYIFDISPDLAIQRRQKRENSTKSEDHAEKYRNFDRIRKGFKKLCASNADRYLMLDASLDESTLSTQILKDLENLNMNT